MQPLTTSTFYEPHQHHHHYILGHFHEQYRTSERYFLDQVGDSILDNLKKHISGMDMWFLDRSQWSNTYIVLSLYCTLCTFI